MPVIAVVNRKGGSGKSTLAAHLAAWCAHQGHAVMLGDVDRQQSTRSWLRKRNEALPAIAPWTVDQNILRVPAGITHVVLDTPGGLHGFDLARMVMFADIILMPVCGSAFDRESAADCHAELMALPRVATGRCKVACIGMRLDTRTRTPQVLKEWATGLGMPFLGVLRESQTYVQCLERGMTLFD
ncbi:MAG: ParA family protein, partial [Curvibacter sp.]